MSTSVRRKPVLSWSAPSGDVSAGTREPSSRRAATPRDYPDDSDSTTPKTMSLRVSAVLLLLAPSGACGGVDVRTTERSPEREHASTGDEGERSDESERHLRPAIELDGAEIHLALQEPRPAIVYVLVRASTTVAPERLNRRLRRHWRAHEAALERVKALGTQRHEAMWALEDELRALPEQELTPARRAELRARREALMQRFQPRMERATARLDARRTRALEAFRAHVLDAFDRASSTEVLALAELEVQQATAEAADGVDLPDVSRAIDLLRRLVHRGRFEEHDERRARYLLGCLLAQTGEHDAAAESWEALLDAPGEELQAEVRFRLGEHYFDSGDLARAIAAYRAVPEGDPTYDLALYRLAWSHWVAGDTNEARSAALRQIAYAEAGRATPGRGEEKIPEMVQLIAETLASDEDDRGAALGDEVAAPRRATILARLSRLLTDRGLLARARVALEAAEAAGDGDEIAAARRALAARSGSVHLRIVAFIEATARQCHELEPGRYAVTLEPGAQGPVVTIEGLEPEGCDAVVWEGDERVRGTATLTVTDARR